MRLKYGKVNVMPFANKTKATKFKNRVMKLGYKATIARKNAEKKYWKGGVKI